MFLLLLRRKRSFSFVHLNGRYISPVLHFLSLRMNKYSSFEYKRERENRRSSFEYHFLSQCFMTLFCVVPTCLPHDSSARCRKKGNKKEQREKMSLQFVISETARQAHDITASFPSCVTHPAKFAAAIVFKRDGLPQTEEGRQLNWLSK